MLKNYIKITFRSLWKSKVFVLINVLGMGVALACCIIAYLNYNYNKDFDIQHENAENIYKVNFIRNFQGNISKNGITPMPIGNLIRGKISGVESAIRYMPRSGSVKIEDDLFNTQIGYADEGFLDLFTFPLKSGSKKDFGNKSNIYISSKLAVRYFGEQEALGKQITHVLDSGTREYIVAGVFEDIPPNSSFYFSALTHFDNYLDLIKAEESDWKRWNTLFLEVTDKSKVPYVEKELLQYKEAQNKARQDFQVSEFYLDPLVGMAVRTEVENVNNNYLNSGLPIAAAIAPVVMSVLILLIAVFNFTNTSIAMASRRLKEIGIRKVMGSRKKQLVIQFITENMILCFLAGIFALIIAEFLVPAYNGMWDFLELDLNYLSNIGFLLFMFGLLIITGLLAGSYPAFYVSSFEPTSILKGTFKFGGTNWVTKVLLGMQFLFTIIALVSSVGFIQNANYQKEFDLGFSTDNVVYTYINGEDEFQTLKNALIKNPDIQTIAGTKHHIMSYNYGDPVKYKDLEREVDIFEVGHDYFDVMDIELLSGRNFKADSETDIQESIIVNRLFAEQFGWKEEEILGKRITWRDSVQLYVVGTVGDIYTSALWGTIDPLMFRLNRKEDYSRLLVKAKNKDLRKIDKFMEAEWKKIFPNKIYFSDFMDDAMAEATLINKNIMKLFVFLGLMATLLSASGLYTMVSLNIIKRMKEIGVRKVLGASVANIAQKLNAQFGLIMVIAAIHASAASYYLLDALMGSIWDYYQQANFITFISGTVVMFVVAIVTVGYKVFTAASSNPVNTLRDE